MSPKVKNSPQGNNTGVYSQTKQVLARDPMVLVLFAFIGLLDLIALTCLFLSHSGFTGKLLGPIIRRFWGDRFLHYPDNFILLPKLFGHAHVLILSVFGLLITAIVILKIHSIISGGRQLSTFAALKTAFRKYFPMLLIWIPVFLAMRYSTRALLPLIPPGVAYQFAMVFILFLLLQALTAFLFPAVVLSTKGFFKSIAEGFILAIQNLPRVIAVLFIPILAAVGMSYAKAMTGFWLRICPEAVLIVLVIGILVTLLVDLFVTSATTLLYLKVRKQ